MAEGVTYAVDVLFRGKDQGTKKTLDDIAGYANKAKKQTFDFTKSLLYKRDALKASNQHLAFGARKQRDFSAALHGTMARNRTDQIKRWFGSIREGAQGASSPLSGLTSMLGGVAAGVGIFGALSLGKSAFIDFNSSVEMSTISLAAQEKMLLGGKWSSAMGNATQLFSDYQKVAATSIGSTEDYLEMHKGIASSAYRAGLGMAELKSMTIGATVAAVALGERADMVALDIKQMLSGDVTSRDRTAQILLASQGVTQNAFNKMDAKQRNKIIMAGLNDPALKDAAKAYGNTFAGAWSAFQDNMKITLGKVGLPLFKAVTKEIQRWSAWVEKNPEKIAKFATQFKDALVSGFNAVKSAVGWIIENKGMLLKLAEAVIIMKGASLAGGLLRSAAGLGAGGGAGSVAATAGITYAVATAVAEKANRDQDRAMLRSADTSVLKDNLARFRAGGLSSGLLGLQANDRAMQLGARAAMRNARDMGMLGKDGGVDRAGVYRGLYGETGVAAMLAGNRTEEAEAVIRGLTDAMAELRRQAEVLAPNLRLMVAGGREVAGVFTGLKDSFGRVLGFGPTLPSDAKKKPDGDGDKNFNVKIEQKILSEDPDRFAVQTNRMLRRLAANPRAARRTVMTSF